jgi:hypothetical protein
LEVQAFKKKIFLIFSHVLKEMRTSAGNGAASHHKRPQNFNLTASN